jgi:hypothetical protein
MDALIINILSRTRQLKGHPTAPNPLQLWLYGLLCDSRKLTLAGSDKPAV